MSRYKAYGEYQHSGGQWLEVIPAHWKLVSLKNITATRVTDGPHETPEFIGEGIPFLSVDGIQENKLVFEGCRYISRNDHERYSVKCLPRFGNVLLGKAASVGKVAFVDSDIEFNVWSPLAVISPKSSKLGKFIYYSFQSALLQMQCEIYSNSNTQKNLGMGIIDNLQFSAPGDDEAETIANFLDHETAKIDTLIEKQQQLIKLLKEKRQTVISHAVTKGLNPNAPMRDSGVEWLDEVPAHWEVSTLKRVLRKITDGEHISPNFVDKGMPFLSAKDIRDRTIEYEVDKFVSYEDGSRFRRRCNPEIGDVLIVSRGATIGRVGLVEKETIFCLLGSVILLKLNTTVADFVFVYYMLNQNSIKEQFLLASQASAQQAMYLVDVAELQIAVPPINEQIEIRKFLEVKIEKIESLTHKAENVIKLMQERRTALISAAVTGKIDVRDWQLSSSSNLQEIAL